MSNGGTPTEREREKKLDGLEENERLLSHTKAAPPTTDETSKLIEKEGIEIGKVLFFL